ncbi:MAG TPA: S8 family serine peptidase [Gaiellaceae bacterium]|jgi:subtilisin family serine protease
MKTLKATAAAALAASVLAASSQAARDPAAGVVWPNSTAVVTYSTEHALDRALARHPARAVRRLPGLRVVALRPAGDVSRYAALLAAEPGIDRVERASPRRPLGDPSLFPAVNGAPLQWQHAAIRADAVSPEIARAAAGVTIAVIDTGADLSAPDLAAKAPVTYSVRSHTPDVTDLNGHGTFVAALAAGSGSNGDGIAGVASEAKLMIVQAGASSGAFTDVEEAAAILFAVDQGARILNLSLGGPTTSTVERRAVQYAAARGALLVAAVGNGAAHGNAVEYPAALLQPLGSRGVGGIGLSVAASDRAGGHAAFSSTGTHVSLAAPGVDVFSAVSSFSSAARYPRTALPGSLTGLYGFGSGTSFSAPQVAGAAALVWAANPALRPDEVAAVLEETASGRGTWTPELGYGVVDVAAAVAHAQARPAATHVPLVGRRLGTRVELFWTPTAGAASFTVSVSRNGGPARALGVASTASSGSYPVLPGGVYSFTVAALDAAGTVVTRSAPWTVSLEPAAATLALSASLLRPAGRVALDARLIVPELPSGERGRTIVLERLLRGRWLRAATAVTDARGHAAWRVALLPGQHRLRARYPGTTEVAAALSRAVTLRISR